jgi:hypothetical protein
MRLSEKTIELNFCAQFARYFAGRIIWFGLTQRQEAQAGFDACTRLGGLLLLIQFKASSHDVNWAFPPPHHASARRFHAPHHQLVALQARSTPGRRVVYAFPLIGTTLELGRQQDVISTTWLLDVATIPPLPPPTTRAGVARKSQLHYVDVIPSHAVIHSDPVSVPLISPSALAEMLVADLRELRDARRAGVADAASTRTNFDRFWPSRQRLFPRHALGAIILPPA